VELCGSLVVTLLLAGSLTDATWLYQPTGGAGLVEAGQRDFSAEKAGWWGYPETRSNNVYLSLFSHLTNNYRTTIEHAHLLQQYHQTTE